MHSLLGDYFQLTSSKILTIMQFYGKAPVINSAYEVYCSSSVLDILYGHSHIRHVEVLQLHNNKECMTSLISTL